MLHDIFGRERHRTDREDMGGVGSFNREGKTIYIGGLKIEKENKGQNLEEILIKQFSEWGDIENVRVVHSKGLAFIKYRLRASAEFAKEAMSDQTLGISDEVLNIRWANDDPTLGNSVRDNSHAQIQAADKILNKWGSTALWEVANDGHYPNTDTQYAEYEAIIKRSGLPPGLTPKPNSLAAMASQHTPNYNTDNSDMYPTLDQMTPEQQEYYNNYYAQLSQMTPEQQEYYNNYYAQFSQMTPEQQQEYYKNYAQYYQNYTESLSSIATNYETDGNGGTTSETSGEVKTNEKEELPKEEKKEVPIIEETKEEKKVETKEEKKTNNFNSYRKRR